MSSPIGPDEFDEFDCVAWTLHQGNEVEQWSPRSQLALIGTLVAILSGTAAGRALYAEALALAADIGAGV